MTAQIGNLFSGTSDIFPEPETDKNILRIYSDSNRKNLKNIETGKIYGIHAKAECMEDEVQCYQNLFGRTDKFLEIPRVKLFSTNKFFTPPLFEPTNNELPTKLL